MRIDDAMNSLGYKALSNGEGRKQVTEGIVFREEDEFMLFHSLFSWIYTIDN